MKRKQLRKILEDDDEISFIILHENGKYDHKINQNDMFRFYGLLSTIIEAMNEKLLDDMSNKLFGRSPVEMNDDMDYE